MSLEDLAATLPDSIFAHAASDVAAELAGEPAQAPDKPQAASETQNPKNVAPAAADTPAAAGDDPEPEPDDTAAPGDDTLNAGEGDDTLGGGGDDLDPKPAPDDDPEPPAAEPPPRKVARSAAPPAELESLTTEEAGELATIESLLAELDKVEDAEFDPYTHGRQQNKLLRRQQQLQAKDTAAVRKRLAADDAARRQDEVWQQHEAHHGLPAEDLRGLWDEQVEAYAAKYPAFSPEQIQALAVDGYERAVAARKAAAAAPADDGAGEAIHDTSEGDVAPRKPAAALPAKRLPPITERGADAIPAVKRTAAPRQAEPSIGQQLSRLGSDALRSFVSN